MSKNSNLHNAKAAKNDDFFTQLSDIENELQHYWSHGVNHFEGKSVLMNCDNPKFSNFWVYFHKNFNKLKLTRIGAIHYSTSEPAYYKEYTGGDDFDITVGNETLLRGNGDFRSEECIEILKGYDMVVTNPPFSLLRDFIAQLMAYNKEFAIIANMNAITYKEVFPLLKENKMWLGVASGAKSYILPSDSPNISKSQVYNKDGVWYQKLGNTCWFTNIDLQRRHDWMVLSKEYTPEEYPKYDNYAAINVNKVSDIPVDYFESYVVDIENKSRLTDYHVYDDIYEFLDAVKYKELQFDKIAIEHNGKLIIPVVKDNANEVNDSLILKGIIGAEYRNGIIGVPVTFLDKHCPEQFEIIECTPTRSEKIWGNNHDYSYYKDFKRGKVVTNAGADMPLLTTEKCGGTKCVRADGEVIYQLYHRMFIKPLIFVDTRVDIRQKADKLSNDLMKILSVPGAIKQELTHLRVVEDE